MWKIRISRPEDGPRAVTIWRDAVDATHHFLTRADRLAIDELVQSFLPQSSLWLAVDPNDIAVGFMGLFDAHMESLFVAPTHHGLGVGRALVAHALALHPTIRTEVNEQNTQAVGFYRHMGFVPFGRSETDEDGRPYPLIHMRLGQNT